MATIRRAKRPATRYLVTGGAGFIGSSLVDLLAARGDSVLVLDDLSTGRRENIEHHLDGSSRNGGASRQVRFVEGSVLDTDLVDNSMRSVDVCLHLASAVGVQLVVRQPLQSLIRNVRGNDIVISAAARHKRRLLFTSTSEIYGKSSAASLTEDADRVLGSPFVSRWSYATAKAFGEALAYEYHRDRGAENIVVRLFNTVGPRQTGAYGMVLPRFVRQALAGEDLTVYGTGLQSRCFVHVLDAVHAIVLLADSEQAPGHVFNIGSSTAVTIAELAEKVISRTRSSSGTRLVPYDDAYGEGFEDLPRRRPDCSRLEQLTGWMPTRSLEEAIDDVIAYETGLVDATPAVSPPDTGAAVESA